MLSLGPEALLELQRFTVEELLPGEHICLKLVPG